jgi:molybdenum cofactor cytidylyltransferase
MGRPKQLLRVRGTSLLRHAIAAAIGGGCDPVVVVIGANAQLVRPELQGLDVREVINARWQDGMSSSIARGVDTLAESDLDAIVVMVCDQPHVTPEVISSLAAAHRATRKAVVASTYGGSFGAPALFSRTLFAELAALSGANGAKQVIARHQHETHFVSFPEGAIDVDTPEDFSRLTASASANHRSVPQNSIGS